MPSLAPLARVRLSSLRARRVHRRRSPSARALPWILLLSPLLGLGCSSGPPPLEIVPAEAPVEPPPPPRFLLELEVSGAVELPLPPNDSAQRIESMFWVVPQGDSELVESKGRRLLKTSPEATLELRLRFALLTRELPDVPAALASRLASPPDAGEEDDPQLRWASGLDWSAGQGPRLERWPEVKIGEEWWPYDPAQAALVARPDTLSFGDTPGLGLEAATIEIAPLDGGLTPDEEPATPGE